MRRFGNRAFPLAGTALLVATLALAGGPSAAGASSGAWRRCAGTVAVTNPQIGRAIASDITVRGAINCQGGKRTIRAFFRKALQANERCAEAANNPPYKGCHVGAFTCRSSASLLSAKGCFDGEERVDFRERDVPLG